MKYCKIIIYIGIAMIILFILNILIYRIFKIILINDLGIWVALGVFGIYVIFAGLIVYDDEKEKSVELNAR